MCQEFCPQGERCTPSPSRPPPRQTHLLLGRHPSPVETPLETATAVDAMHPSGMHSCYRLQRSWGKVMFLQASVILSTGGEYLTRYTPRTRYTPQDQVHPWDQVHPLGPGTPSPPGPGSPPTRYTPLGTRYTPLDQVHPPGPGTPPWTRYTPQDQVHPPGPGTPPWTRYTPRDQVHPPGTRYTPPPGAEYAGRYGQRAGGTHPTGMQSC